MQKAVAHYRQQQLSESGKTFRTLIVMKQTADSMAATVRRHQTPEVLTLAYALRVHVEMAESHVWASLQDACLMP